MSDKSLTEMDVAGYEAERQAALGGNWICTSAQWFQRKDGQSLTVHLRTDRCGAADGNSLHSVEDLVGATCRFIVDAPLIVDDLVSALRAAWAAKRDVRAHAAAILAGGRLNDLDLILIEQIAAVASDEVRQ